LNRDDGEEFNELAMMCEMGFFLRTGERYQMVIPADLNMETVKRAVLKFARTEDDLQDLIVAIIKNSEKMAQEEETAARRQELAVRREQERKQREQERIDKWTEHKRKEKEKAFESLISLPNEQQQSRLGELAKRLNEDVTVIRDHFTAFVGMQSWAA